MIKLTSEKENIQNYLNNTGFLNSDEAIQTVEIPGEGNMNFTLRIITNFRSFIIKQSRDYVEKYPQVAAPEERVLREAEFYEIIKDNEVLSRKTPGILSVDKDNHVIIMEDLGTGSDYTNLYAADKSISEAELKEVMHFIADLHSQFKRSDAQHPLPNREMRKLNHEHIFRYPYAHNNGINLDEILPGLAAVGEKVKNDTDLKTAVSQLGEQYLADGENLLHGDYFPGSWLNTEAGLKIIDPEFCFFGPAEFEIGVCLAHLYMAQQPHTHIKMAMDFYKEKAPFDDMLMMKFMAIEMLRRILGLAQLPLNLNLEERTALVERSVMILTRY